MIFGAIWQSVWVLTVGIGVGLEDEAVEFDVAEDALADVPLLCEADS